MSTTLPLLKYQTVSDRLIFLEGNQGSQSRTKITHVAVLNHTLDKNVKGALCLLLCQGTSEEVFRRVKSFPALLPVVGGLSSELHKRKILVCPGPTTSDENDHVNSLFSLSGDNFKAKLWTCKGDIWHLVVAKQDDLNTDFELRTKKVESSKRRVEVSCEITDSRDPGAAMLLRIIKIDEAWSIKEVSRLRQGKRSHQKHTKFLSTVLVDRCSFRLSCGKRVSIGLRRLSAGCRPEHLAFMPRYRYQIVVKRL
ncbi:hypothetical protein B0J14DRAFT_236502 [Halenospora varia]|nr:hypothetical protein B0J14DRAFT_236502 [Halenospora varia]